MLLKGYIYWVLYSGCYRQVMRDMHLVSIGQGFYNVSVIRLAGWWLVRAWFAVLVELLFDLGKLAFPVMLGWFIVCHDDLLGC